MWIGEMDQMVALWRLVVKSGRCGLGGWPMGMGWELGRYLGWLVGCLLWVSLVGEGEKGGGGWAGGGG